MRQLKLILCSQVCLLAAAVLSVAAQTVTCFEDVPQAQPSDRPLYRFEDILWVSEPSLTTSLAPRGGRPRSRCDQEWWSKYVRQGLLQGATTAIFLDEVVARAQAAYEPFVCRLDSPEDSNKSVDWQTVVDELWTLDEPDTAPYADVARIGRPYWEVYQRRCELIIERRAYNRALSIAGRRTSAELEAILSERKRRLNSSRTKLLSAQDQLRSVLQTEKPITSVAEIVPVSEPDHATPATFYDAVEKAFLQSPRTAFAIRRARLDLQAERVSDDIVKSGIADTMRACLDQVADVANFAGWSVDGSTTRDVSTVLTRTVAALETIAQEVIQLRGDVAKAELEVDQSLVEVQALTATLKLKRQEIAEPEKDAEVATLLSTYGNIADAEINLVEKQVDLELAQLELRLATGDFPVATTTLDSVPVSRIAERRLHLGR